jgi:fucose permease
MVPTFMIIASDTFPERPSSSSSIFITAVCIANLIAPYFSRIIETRSHMTLLSLIAVSLILSAIIIKLMYRRGKTQ